MINKEILVDKFRNFRKRFNYNYYFGSRDYGKFLIISRSRTGSNLLMSLLNSHPEMEVGGEKFKWLNGSDVRKNWDVQFSKKHKNLKQVGCKLFYYHPLDGNKEELWNMVYSKDDIKVIHLVRENMLDTVISAEIAKKTNNWSKKNFNRDTSIEKKKVKIEPAFCLSEFAKTKRNEKKIDQKIDGKRLHKVTYEELCLNREQVLRQLFDFLNVKNDLVQSSYRKQNKSQKKKLVINYEELVETIRNTKWSYLLEQDF